jgi:lantibiotic modifying enzyme
LARLEVLKCGIKHKSIFTDLDNALKTCLESGFDGGDNLCFGAFGNLELLINYAEFVEDDKLKATYRELTEKRVENGLKKGFNITGKGMYTPGFMNGITGIIYQCLRVHDPKQVPSILGLSL